MERLNFAYDLCVKKVQPEQLASLDLSSWHLAFKEAEPIWGETLDQFSQKFAQCSFNYSAFSPCYGMAETILFIVFEQFNPRIELKDSPFYIVSETQEWEQLKTDTGEVIPRRVGVSSFGFGGVNAHVVLEEALIQVKSQKLKVKSQNNVRTSNSSINSVSKNRKGFRR